MLYQIIKSKLYHITISCILICFAPWGLATSLPLPQPVAPLFIDSPTDFTDNAATFKTYLSRESLLAMQRAIDHYQNLAGTQYWPTIKGQKLLSFGDIDRSLPQVRHKLRVLGDLDEANCESLGDLFDITLHEAVISFQQRHGLKTDGIIGPNTRRLLNLGLQQRANLLQLNLERAEATLTLLQDNDSPLVLVNIPAFKLHLIDNQRELLSMKTIVGRKKRTTPVFNTEIDRIVINPSWHVPMSIAYKDILPALQKNPDYLSKNDLKLVRGWGPGKAHLTQDELDMEHFYLGKNYQRIWQAPSKQNTLGAVKFLTNSHYAVYLHDTSAKKLFDEPTRAFSSGCIRVQKPKLLAEQLYLLGFNTQTPALDSFFSQDETKTLALDTPIPLHVIYLTAWADNQGQLQFRKDIYRKDRALLLTLEAQNKHNSKNFQDK